MPVDYTGSAASIAAHQAATIPTHLDTDAPEAALDNAPLKKLADLLAFLQQYAPIMGAGVANEGPLEIAGNLAIGGQATINSALAVAGEVNHSSRLKSGAPINATDLKLVSEHPGYGTGSGSVRRYVVGNSTTLALVEAINAISEEGTWFREIADQPAYLIRLSQAGFRVLAWPVGDATPFARELRMFEAGMKWSGVGTGAADANPPAATALANTLVAKNVCKAWASISHTKYNAGPPVVNEDLTLDDAINVSGVTLVDSNSAVRVTFASPMADTAYSVCLTSRPGPVTDDLASALPRIKAKTANYVDLGFGSWSNLLTSGWGLDVHIFGKQSS